MVDPSLWTVHYQGGVPAEISLPREPLTALIETAVKEAPNQVATDFFGATLTYRELGEKISRAAEGLRRVGVRRGDRVALILPNSPQHIIAFYAILRLGAIAVEHNPLYTPRELRHMFENHTAVVAICCDAAVEKLRQQPHDIVLENIIAVNLLDEFPRSKKIALRLPGMRKMRSKLTAKAPHTTSWRKLLANRGLNRNHRQPLVGDVAAIQYTSGSTGLPRGAMLTHMNLHANAIQARHWLHGMELGKEVFFSVLPMFHVFGLSLALTLGVMMQARIVLFPTPDPKMIVSTAKRVSPTVIGGVPPLFHMIATVAKRKKVSFPKAHHCVCGAMALPQQTAEDWERLTGVPLMEGYGLSEASPVLCGNPGGPTRRQGTVGVPFPSTEVRVVDLNNPTHDVEVGQRGELLGKGPQVFQGYWENEEDTATTLLPGGWLRTGDIVEQSADGYITIVDRVKELIITGGFNVTPTEVETIIRSHADIEDVAVVGIPLPMGGERVAAAVVMHQGCRLDADKLRDYCRERLTAYKVPKLIVEVNDLPKSMLGKVLRGQVRANLIATHPVK